MAGLVVKGDHVTTYGLSVEHFLQDNTLWQGDNGAMYFYQCELPYDVTQDEYCPNDKCYAGLRIDEAVTNFIGTAPLPLPLPVLLSSCSCSIPALL
jgi:hypothetical protein